VVPNVAGCELYGGQWRLSEGGKYMYDLFVCSNASAPSITVQDTVKPLV